MSHKPWICTIVLLALACTSCATPKTQPPAAAPQPASNTANITKLMSDFATLRTQTQSLSANVTALKRRVDALPSEQVVPTITIPPELNDIRASLNGLSAQFAELRGRQDKLAADVTASIQANQKYVDQAMQNHYMTQSQRMILEARLTNDEALIKALEAKLVAHGWQ